MSDTITKFYYCSICKKRHSIEFPSDFAQNRTHYPFVHFFIHKFQGDPKKHIEKIGADIITTLYIDKNLTVRGSEVALEDPNANIMNRDDAQTMITFLTNHINELQEAYDHLSEQYTELLESVQLKS